jgi:hypothetical protein
LLICGGSGIIDPLGGVLVEPNFAGESIRVAELDRRIIARESTILMLSGITPALTSSG